MKELAKKSSLLLLILTLSLTITACSDDETEEVEDEIEKTLNVLVVEYEDDGEEFIGTELGIVELEDEVAEFESAIEKDYPKDKTVTLEAKPDKDESAIFQGWKAYPGGDWISQDKVREVTMTEDKTYYAVFEERTEEIEDARLAPKKIEYIPDRVDDDISTTVLWNDATYIKYLTGEGIEETPTGDYGNNDWEVNYDESELLLKDDFLENFDTGDELNFSVGFNDGEDVLLTVKLLAVYNEDKDIEYETLQEAVNDADDEDRITLYDDLEEDVIVDKGLTMDFEQYTLTGNLTFEHEQKNNSTLQGWSPWHGDRIDGDLIVDTPNAEFTNEIDVSGEVIIDDVSNGSWNEEVDGNNLIINASDATININQNTRRLTVSDGADSKLNIEGSGSVDRLDVDYNSNLEVDIQGSVEQFSGEEGSTIELLSGFENIESYDFAGEVIHRSVIGVSIAEEDMTIGGETVDLTANIETEDAWNQEVSWSSSNEDVVTVDNTGEIEGVSAGTETVTVTTDDGGYKDSIEITVEEIVYDVISIENVDIIDVIDYELAVSVLNDDEVSTVEISDLPDDASIEADYEDGSAMFTDDKKIRIDESENENREVTIKAKDDAGNVIESRVVELPKE